MKPEQKAEEVVAAIKPLLAGQGQAVQGAVLADLAATWIAGHHPDMRLAAMGSLVRLIADLIEENEKEIFGAGGFPRSGLQ